MDLRARISWVRPFIPFQYLVRGGPCDAWSPDGKSIQWKMDDLRVSLALALCLAVAILEVISSGEMDDAARDD
jgi:hypothetical protein